MKLLNYYLTLIIIALSLYACNSDSNDDPNNTNTINNNSTKEISLPDLSVENGKISLDSKEYSTSKNINHFAFILFRDFIDNDEQKINPCISPISIAFSLSMAANGSSGDTFNQIAKVLMSECVDLETLNNYNYKIGNGLPMIAPDINISINNAVFSNNSISLNENFLNRIAAYYNAENFTFDSTDINNNIKEWIREKTNLNIDVFNFPSNNDLILVNNLNFNSRWSYTFDSSLTKQGNFTNFDDSSSNTLFMSTSLDKISFVENDIFSSLTIPLGDLSDSEGFESPFNFFVMLPNQGYQTDDIILWLCENNIDYLESPTYEFTVDLKIPKFKITNNISLKETLIKQGINNAFEPALADFSKMSDNSGLIIDNIIQSNYIAIDEKGIDASSVSFIDMAIADGPTELKFMHLNRPFIYVLAERNSNTILYIGEINKL